ncbi:TPA: heme exporter protein CcmD [Serratia fonticola]
MNAAFSSWQAFFAMGGYAFYVWLAVAVTLLSLLGLLVHTLWQRKQLLAEVSRQASRERRIRQSQQSKQSPATPQPVNSREKSQ